jgi:hypothetical protein
MKHRQSGETAAKKKSVFGIILLVVAFALFCGSAISFCWAISNAKDAQDGANVEVNNAGSNEEDNYDDEAESDANLAKENQSSIDEQNSTQNCESENAEAAGNDTSNKVSSANNNSNEEVAGSIKLDAKDLSGSSNSKKSDKKSKSKKTTKSKSKAKSNAYHTAYWKEPIYKETKHYAAKQRLITINNETTIEWTYCKTCGKSHKNSYTDKVLVHYEEHFCEVCGKKHKHGYFE